MKKYITDEDLKSYEDTVDRMSYTRGTAYCGYGCHLDNEYGFVPKAGCPVHYK